MATTARTSPASAIPVRLRMACNRTSRLLSISRVPTAVMASPGCSASASEAATSTETASNRTSALESRRQAATAAMAAWSRKRASRPSARSTQRLMSPVGKPKRLHSAVITCSSPLSVDSTSASTTICLTRAPGCSSRAISVSTRRGSPRGARRGSNWAPKLPKLASAWVRRLLAAAMACALPLPPPTTLASTSAAASLTWGLECSNRAHTAAIAPWSSGFTTLHKILAASIHTSGLVCSINTRALSVTRGPSVLPTSIKAFTADSLI
mmetsp:Transcript_103442/g.319161  ORF Transcript_103442/g.319161 Transcript_103442/m.319161 type:complete len:268 (-) Transcript_103442:279-1082(-)